VKDEDQSGVLARTISRASSIKNQFRALNVPNNAALVRKFTRAIEEVEAKGD